MRNQLYTGTPTSRRQVTLPEAVNGGDPILVGVIPAVALDDWQSVVDGATCLENGTFLLSVKGETAASPLVTSTVKPGDRIYAVGGTLDSATNVRYGFTLSKDSSGILFGTLDPSPQAGGPVTAGTTATVGVQIGV